jgi:hypothetical protein
MVQPVSAEAKAEDCRMLPKAMGVIVAERPSPTPLRPPSALRAFPPVFPGSMLITLARSPLPLVLRVQVVAGGGRGAESMRLRPGRRLRLPLMAVLDPLLPRRQRQLQRIQQLSTPVICVQRGQQFPRHRCHLLIRPTDDRKVPTRHLMIR